MSVTMTPDAADRIQSFIVNRGKGLGLRLGIKTTGCSGLAYVMEFVDELNEDDTLFSISDVNIIIDGKSLVYLDGIEVDGSYGSNVSWDLTGGQTVGQTVSVPQPPPPPPLPPPISNVVSAGREPSNRGEASLIISMRDGKCARHHDEDPLALITLAQRDLVTAKETSRLMEDGLYDG